MKDLKFQVIYKNHFYEFEDGMAVYLFHFGMEQDFIRRYSEKQLVDFAKFLAECYHSDFDNINLYDMALFAVNNWYKVNIMDKSEFLDYYCKSKETSGG